MTATKVIDLPMPPMPWVGIIAASLASSILTLGLPISVLQVYDRVLPNQSMSTLGVLVITLIFVVIMDAILKTFRGQLLSWTAAKYEYQLGSALTSALLNARLDLLEHDGPGTQSRRLAAIDNLKGFYCGSAATAVFDLPLVVISLALVTLIGGWLVVIPLALTAVFLLIGWWIGNRLHAVLSDRNVNDDRRQNFLVELFSGIDSVKALVLEEQMRRRYERLLDGAGPLVYRAAKLTAVVRGMSDAFAQMMVVAVASAAAWFVIRGEMSLGEMAACTLLCGRTLQPTLQTLGLWSQYQTTRIARKQLAAGLSLPAQASGCVQPELKGVLELSGVGYLHPKTRTTIFEDLDLHAEPGEIVGIRGGDGSGKSSLVQIIMGMVSPDRGEVRFDGMPISEIDLRSLRSQIGVVGERAPRFNGTLMDNLTLFQGEDVAVDEAELLRILGIDEAVAKLAQGYSTRIHAGATDASESLLQRVGIARAILNRPKILILDEANNSLDQEGDRHLAELLVHLKGRMTVLLITQRPSLLAIADRSLELASGKLTPLQKQPMSKLGGPGAEARAMGGTPPIGTGRNG
ncbi:MAG: ABC transporter transmembrane domain-containing protein [Alphaproteobacteria bacterium]|nr:ABC transporter transmembrane domain-containing protein [Alphaproteobacteria bacterium]